MGSIRVVGFGAMNLDQLYRVQSVLADNETTIGEHESSPGGSAANTISGLAKLGISTGFVGAVGDDEIGELLLQDFSNVGVDISQVKIKKHAKTGSVLGLTDYYGKRALYVAPGANSFLKKEDISLDYIAQAELAHLSSFVDDQQFEIQKWVVKNLPTSVKVSFTPGAIYARKGLDALAPLLKKTDILFVNEREIEELVGADFRVAARRLISKGCQTVIVTLGRRTLQEINEGQLPMFDFDRYPQVLSAQSIDDDNTKGGKAELFTFATYIADANNEYVINSKAGYKKDTTGAGDAFATGFLYGLLNIKSFAECSQLGSLVAQFSIMEMGARPGLPTINQLARRCRKLHNIKL